VREATVRETSVLVAGGGLVGLTAALVLRHHGVAVTVAEKRTTPSPQPKARRFHVRSMEIFRELGLAGLVREAARDLADHDHMAEGHTLAQAAQLPLWQPAGQQPVADISPELPCLIAQDLLEPLLRTAAARAGAVVLPGTALTGFEQDGDGVTGLLGDTAIRARYLIAADGAHSSVREALGITRSGRGAAGPPVVSVYFRADLAGVVVGREFNLCRITHPGAAGTLASVDGRRRWVFMSAGEAAGDDRAALGWPSVLRTALGVPAPGLEILSVLRWQPEMLVADRYSAGRVHLAGDAAHVMPPFAALGANTGIADVHNLGWKLAAVLAGQAAPALLDSYHAERRPAGWFAADQSARRGRAVRLGVPGDPDLAHPLVLAAGGFQYPGGAFAPGGPAEPVTSFAPAGRPGTRVPHRWTDPARTRSTLDLAGPGWAVVTSAQADFLGAGECLLLRPDHVVAWRGASAAGAWRIRSALLAGGPQVRTNCSPPSMS
jgi:putative polyketide hydroxylase